MEIRDLCIGRDYTDKMNNKKTKWTKVGTMFIKEENGETKISMIFDAYPAHGENIVAFKQKPREEKWQEGSQAPAKEEVPTINLEEEPAEIVEPAQEEVTVNGERVPF